MASTVLKRKCAKTQSNWNGKKEDGERQKIIIPCTKS